MHTYVNYDLHIITQQDQSYFLRADCPLAGQVSQQAVPPFSDEEIDILCWQDTAIQSDPKEIGRHLYEAIFQNTIGQHFHQSLAAANAQTQGLRIRLRLSESPQLARLPWEYLYDATHDNFFALSTQTPIVRYLDLPLAESELTVDGPLQILVILSDPVDLVPRLDVEQEWNQTQATFQALEETGGVRLHRLPNVTRPQLQRYLREHQVDILHFIGHGLYDEQDHEGLLVFEDDNGQAELVSAEVLTSLLQDHMPRFVYLNSCETARSGVHTSLAGTAQKLVQKGLPAAIAMQTAISDERAGQIAHEFYLALMAGHPVDVALAEGRKAVFDPNESTEWGTPVLFMRSPDGILWNQEILKGEEMESPTQRWWDQLPQQIETSGGDVIIGRVGNASGQTAIGKNITQSIHEVLGEPTPDDGKLVEQAFAPLNAILPQLDPTKRSFAEFQIELLNGELSKIDESEMPSATTIIQIGDWLLENVPEMKSALNDLLETPAVGRVLVRTGEEVVGWVQRQFESLSRV